MENKRWLCIVNPKASGTKLEQAWDSIAQQLEEVGLLFDVSFTQKKEHAILLVKDAVANGYRKFIGVGGDGTNNEIINGLLEQKLVSPLDLTYALFPFGTGNDWSRTHKIPTVVKDWFAMLENKKTINHSVAQIKIEQRKNTIKRYFINIAGFAYDAHIVKTSENYPNKSRSEWLYLWLVFKCLFNFSSPRLTINFDGVKRKGKYYTVNCGVCNYSGGGMKLLPQADPQSDFLAITLIKDFSKWLVPFASPKLFSGRVAKFKHAEVTTCQAINIVAAADYNLDIEVDGEYLGTGKVGLSILPNALKIIVP